MKELKELKVGDFFKLKPTGRVYVRGEYVRSLKRYSYYDFDDVCREHFAKGSKRVIVNFEFQITKLIRYETSKNPKNERENHFYLLCKCDILFA